MGRGSVRPPTATREAEQVRRACRWVSARTYEFEKIRGGGGGGGGAGTVRRMRRGSEARWRVMIQGGAAAGVLLVVEGGLLVFPIIHRVEGRVEVQHERRALPLGCRLCHVSLRLRHGLDAGREGGRGGSSRQAGGRVVDGRTTGSRRQGTAGVPGRRHVNPRRHAESRLAQPIVYQMLVLFLTKESKTCGLPVRPCWGPSSQSPRPAPHGVIIGAGVHPCQPLRRPRCQACTRLCRHPRHCS